MGPPVKQLIVAATLGLLTLQATAQDAPTQVKEQTAGSHPQRVEETPRSRAQEKQKHWTDPMNTKDSADPRQRDDYGVPKVTPPSGQGTDNSGGIPKTDGHHP